MILKKIVLIFCLSIFFSSRLVLAQSSSEKRQKIDAVLPTLDKIFKEYAEKNHYPSVTYGLMLDGQLIHTFNSGFGNLRTKMLASPQSVYRIASMTKSLVALAIVQLRDAQKLQLDDPVARYIPEMQNQPYPTPDSPPVTIRHLLTHAAGFPEDNPWGDRQLAVSDEQLTALLRQGVSYANPPGVAYEYSNLGFAMLGLIIKKVSGESYQSYINKQVLAPLGMKHTYWEYSQVPDNQLVIGYRYLKNQWVEQPMLHDGAYGAMGGLLTSMEDFARYVAFFQWAWDDTQTNAKYSAILKAASLREMQMPWNFSSLSPQSQLPSGRVCPTVSAYGYGLRWTKDCDNRTMVGHSGGLPGFGSNWRILPDYGLGIISFVNHTYASAGYINLAALDTLIRVAQLRPRDLAITPILNQRKTELLKILPDWNNAPQAGIFADNFFLDYFPDMLRQEAQGVFGQAGKILKISEIIPENRLRGTFTLEGEKANVEIFFTLTPEAKPLIQEYRIRLVNKK
ncbi:MAG: beta-lactamase family protein [Microscillaceae bacterium]|jgi:CubicO group peptidase (beta-lactamase class C family)|nr:beta-lactamase family protein [Microscillaceae bacterium]